MQLPRPRSRTRRPSFIGIERPVEAKTMEQNEEWTGARRHESPATIEGVRDDDPVVAVKLAAPTWT